MHNPYDYSEDTQHIVFYSGGVQSAYIPQLLLEHIPPERITLLHSDSCTEHPDTYRFLHETAEYHRLPLTVVADGRDLYELSRDEDRIPSPRARFCTRYLKMEPADEYLEQLDRPYVCYLGFGPEEFGRAQKISTRRPKRRYRYPLLEQNISKPEIMSTIRNKWRICLPELYLYFDHANCLPCVMYSLQGWALCLEYYPDAYEKMARLERELRYYVRPEGYLDDLYHRFERESSYYRSIRETQEVPCLCAV